MSAPVAATLAHLKERLADFNSDAATGHGDVYGLKLTRAERNVLRAVLAENERMQAELERLTPRTADCPACQRPTKLTPTGLFRLRGPHRRPCKASGTHPVADAVAAPQ
jgi:hypothetical protein